MISVVAKISNLNEWWGENGIGGRIRRGGQTMLGFKNFLHRRIIKKSLDLTLQDQMQRRLRKRGKMVIITREAVLAPAELMWQRRCELTASAEEANVVVGRKKKASSEGDTLLLKLGRTCLAHPVGGMAAQI